jgi:hypothetical protein
MTFSLSLIFAFYGYQHKAALDKRKAMPNLSGMQATLAVKIQMIKGFQDELTRLNQKAKALEAVTTNVSYSRVLLKLAEMMNGYTWLTQLTLQNGEEREGLAGLKMTGFSLYNEELGNFLSWLTSEPMFEDVSLKYARETFGGNFDQDEADPVKMLQFQIECEIHRG